MHQPASPLALEKPAACVIGCVSSSPGSLEGEGRRVGCPLWEGPAVPLAPPAEDATVSFLRKQESRFSASPHRGRGRPEPRPL